MPKGCEEALVRCGQPDGARPPVGVVVAVSVAPRRGMRKANQPRVELRAGQGMAGDAHAGPGHRQVSLLAMESIDAMRAQGLTVGPGDFAENITTAGLDLPSLPVGTRMRVGAVILEVSQIGKECLHPCAIYAQAGDCVMPREGIFTRVLAGGEICPGEGIEVLTAETERRGGCIQPRS